MYGSYCRLVKGYSAVLQRVWRRAGAGVVLVAACVLCGPAARGAEAPAGAPAGGAPAAAAGAAAAPAPAANPWATSPKEFEGPGRQNPPPQGAVLFVGSSSIGGWDVALSFPDLKTIKRGFGGSQLSDSVFFFERIVRPYAPRVIVLYAGDNDIAAKKTPERIAADFGRFVEKVRADLPKAHLVFLAIKPSTARWSKQSLIREANDLIRARCEKGPRLTFLDVHAPLLGEDGMPRKDLYKADGLHLNKEGYALWTGLLSAHLKGLPAE